MLECELDFGGKRLAMTEDSRACFVAAYHRHGISSYSLEDGAKLWQRRDLKKAHSLYTATDDHRVYCAIEDRPLHVLDRSTGETLEQIRGVTDVYESSYERVLLLGSRRKYRLRTSTKEHKIDPKSFAILGAEFAPGLCVISEAGGPLRCFCTESGKELWGYSKEGEHCLNLAYCETENVFFGILWSYKKAGAFHLTRIDPVTGRIQQIAEFTTVICAFLLSGKFVVSAKGEMRDTSTGRVECVLPFQTTHLGVV